MTLSTAKVESLLQSILSKINSFRVISQVYFSFNILENKYAMKHIMFVCHGNICRSPMGMFILRHKLKELGLENEYEVISCGLETSTKGEDMEERSKKQLDDAGIPYEKHEAHMGHPRDFLTQDYILYMEDFNRVLISRMMSNRHLEKAHRLLDYTDDKRDIVDPYFTNDFSKAFEDINKGIDAFIQSEILPHKE